MIIYWVSQSGNNLLHHLLILPLHLPIPRLHNQIPRPQRRNPPHIILTPNFPTPLTTTPAVILHSIISSLPFRFRLAGILSVAVPIVVFVLVDFMAVPFAFGFGAVFRAVFAFVGGLGTVVATGFGGDVAF